MVLRRALECNGWLRQSLGLLQEFSYEIVVCCALGLPLFFKLAGVAGARQKQKRTLGCLGLKFDLAVLPHGMNLGYSGFDWISSSASVSTIARVAGC